MARNIGADGRTVYRARIVRTYDDDRTVTSHEGPYTEPGPARGRITLWRNRMAYQDGPAVEGHVEQAHTIWTPMGDDVDPIAAVRAQAYCDAADEMEACQTAQDDEERNRHGFLDHESEQQGAAVRDMAAHLRRRAAEIHPAPEEQQP
ncbi:hypothetical protein ABZ690_21020 [Streptomyces sp. NPDC006967]|uniref:hypothetical protein n=1 Tax=unclassified Streptomyces TaxID=2593676 RepID=UPI0033D67A20